MKPEYSKALLLKALPKPECQIHSLLNNPKRTQLHPPSEIRSDDEIAALADKLPFAVRRLLLSEFASRISPLAYIGYLLIPSIVQAQPIVTASDGTNTTISSPDGNRFDISGGQLSGDGANLFHSFQQFGLNQGQIANFLSNSAIQNILARVTGGIPSVINGLIQVTGGNSNLFLMNPSGVVFGANAQLNVPASFIATTANGIGFNGQWFSATGTSNYALLTGNPSAFSFPVNAAAVTNEGHLSVAPGNNLTLMGGTVISVGTLEAPGGQISLVAVPGEGVVRMSQEGHVLSLEIAAPKPGQIGTGEEVAITPVSLPEMLTGGENKGHATGVTVNSAGQVVLTSGQTVNPGTVIVAGTVSAASAASPVGTPTTPALQMGGTVEITGDQITLSRAKIDASGEIGGGRVHIGNGSGFSTPDVTSPEGNLQQPILNAWGSQIHISSDSVIAADAQNSGMGGHVAIVGNTDFQGQISARGGVQLGDGGTVEVTGTGHFSGTVDLMAQKGNLGTVRLQSENLAIVSEARGVTSLENSNSARNPASANALSSGVSSPLTDVSRADVSSPQNAVIPDVSPSSRQEVSQMTVSETALENLTGNANVVLEAKNDIIVESLADHQLNLQAVHGSQALQNMADPTLPPSAVAPPVASTVQHQVTFIADSDQNQVGAFTMANTQDTILVPGGRLSIAGESVKVTGIQGNNAEINLTGNEIELAGGIHGIANGGGTLELQPRNPNQGIYLGGDIDHANTLDLTRQEMATLSDGFKGVTIGRSDGTGTITIEATQVSDPMVIESPGGSITVAGDIQATDNASVRLQAPTTELGADITTQNSDITIQGNVTLTHDATLNTGEGAGEIQIQGTVKSEVNTAHNLTVNAGSGNLTITGNIGAAPHQQLGHFSVQNVNNLKLSSVQVQSFQQLAGTGMTAFDEVSTSDITGVSITTQGNIVAGNITTDGGTVDLTSQGGQVHTGDLNTSPQNLQQGGSIKIQAQSHISTGALISYGLPGGGDITLSSTTGGITVNAIDTHSTYGSGGNVNITSAQFFHRVGTNERIITTGNTSNGTVTLDTNNSQESPRESAAAIAPETAMGGAATAFNLQTALNTVQQLEQSRTQALEIGLENSHQTASLTDQSIQESLNQIARQTGKNPAVIYVISHPDSLELVLVTPHHAPILKQVVDANHQALQQQIGRLIGGVSTRPDPNHPNKYLNSAQQLYQWLIAPLEADLTDQNINSLMFSLDPGMRSLPLAALHDGQQFLVQKYSVGLIPSISLTDRSYQNLHHFSVLAMGAAEFQDPKVVPLPAVPIELSTITEDWQGEAFLNQEFTLENLKAQRTQNTSGIVHLATHGFFDPETPNNSYIQLWNDRLRFEQLRQLGSQGKPVELLVLSACETAFGNADMELGFAGLAVRSGVKSVMASLWQVDDAGTLGLMSEFYRQLKSQPLTYKAEALRQAQIAMIQGDLRVEAGKLRSTSRGVEGVPLPPTDDQETVNLSHPYYWASFTMIGSPW